jgi:Tol biopolymer transport system component
MKTIFLSLTMFALLALSACVSPTDVGATQPSSSDQVTTIVAMTLQAITPEVPGTPTIVPEQSPSLLPHSLYYLGRDSQSISQVYRMERDGKTNTQLTFEPVSVDGYDISLANGSVAYLVNNQLLLVDADGSNRRVLVDGGLRENNPWVTNPVFSPDGQTLAYARNGLNLYSVSTGTANLIIENQLKDAGNGQIETYEPVRYSPDGTKLLLALGHWEVLPSHAVYYPDTNALVRYEEVTDYMYCCSFHGGPVWSPDGSSFYGVASVHDTVYQSGELWKVDAVTGSVTRMLRAEDGMLYLPKELFLAEDGLLYFFLGSYHIDSGFWDAPILNIARSTPDGITEPTVLRDDNFVLMNEVLWADDASFVIVATAPSRDWNQGGGVLELYYTDGPISAVWLAQFGKDMKWGP